MIFDEENDTEHEVTITLTEECADGTEVDHVFIYIIGEFDIFQSVRYIDDTERNFYPIKPYINPDLVRWVVSDVDRRMMQRGYTMSNADLKELKDYFQ